MKAFRCAAWYFNTSPTNHRIHKQVERKKLNGERLALFESDHRIHAARWLAMTDCPRKLQLRQLRECVLERATASTCDARVIKSRNGTLLSCRISLRLANCLAKINHAGWRGCIVGGVTHVPIIAHAGLCCAVFGGRRGQRPVIRLRGAGRNLRAFRKRLCASGTGLSATALRGTRLRISAALLRNAGPCIPCTGSVHGEYGAAYAPQPIYVERAPAYPERYYGKSLYAQERYYAGNATMRWNMRRGRLCPCLIVRGRDATTAMAGRPLRLKPPRADSL